jgi:hypothetical protein
VTGDDLRARIKRLGLSYRAAARRLGLSVAGLQHNMRGERSIGRQTELLIGYIERELSGEPPAPLAAIRPDRDVNKEILTDDGDRRFGHRYVRYLG